MIKTYFIILTVMSVLIAQPSAFVKQSTAEETMGKQSATESSLFSEKMPQHIQCQDIDDFVYSGGGIPPVRKNFLQNNIVPEWNYCLCGVPLFKRPVSGDKVPLGQRFFMLLSCKYGWGAGNDPSSNPVPWIDGMWEHIKTDELPVIQIKLGYFFCNYGIVSKGDIFPLAGELYYVEDCFSAIKVYPENISLPPDKNKGLCIPLVTNTSEIASYASFSYLPWLNLFVARIYAVPSENPPLYLYVARICTNKNVIDVSLLGMSYHDDSPGRPRLKSSSEGKIDIKMERMEIQEVKVGDVIKGDKVG